MQLSDRVKVFNNVFTNNDGYTIPQQILLAVVQYLGFKSPVNFELLVVFIQKLKKTSAERQANSQRHKRCLRTETISFPLREKKP